MSWKCSSWPSCNVFSPLDFSNNPKITSFIVVLIFQICHFKYLGFKNPKSQIGSPPWRVLKVQLFHSNTLLLLGYVISWVQTMSLIHTWLGSTLRGTFLDIRNLSWTQVKVATCSHNLTNVNVVIGIMGFPSNFPHLIFSL
jgi:hypothetical protein